MIRLLKFILFFILGFATLYSIVCCFISNHFEVSQSIVIQSSPYIVFEQINDFENWENWEPWSEQDSTINNTISKLKSGVGSYRSWTSTNSGNGTMTITNSKILESIECDINIEGWNSFNAKFTFNATEKGVKVTWKHYGYLPFLMRGIAPIFKKVMMKDFESGLFNLKEFCENIASKTSDIMLTEWETRPFIYIVDSCSTNNIEYKLTELYTKIYQHLTNKKTKPIGQPFIQYILFPKNIEDEDKVVLKAGTFIETEVEIQGSIKNGHSTAGKILQASHFGSYETLYRTHDKMRLYCDEKNLTTTEKNYEFFINNPDLEPNQMNWETQVIYEIQ